MDVMQAILDIERKAQESLKETEELERQQRDKFLNELKELEENVRQEVDRSLREIEQRSMNDQKEALDKTEREMREQLSALENLYENRKSEWVRQMTANIIG